MSTRLMLVRHGESSWNPLSKYAGQQDVPLSERGRQQARRLARRLANESFVAIYASPLQRARETAAMIADPLRMPVTLDAGLAEISHGVWEGLTATEVSSLFPIEYEQWQLQPHTVQMPNGETLSHVADRVHNSLDRILNRQCEGTILVCAHDAVLRVMVLECLDLGMENFWKFSFENGSLSLMERANDNSGSWRLTFLNDTSHLAGVSSEYELQAL